LTHPILALLFVTHLTAQGWTVSDVQLVENETITLTDDLVVKDGGSLTLRGVTLRLSDQCGIRVETGGSLFIYDNSHITATDPDFPFLYFTAHGKAFEMIDSKIEGCPGLDLRTDGAMILGNIFPDISNVIGIRASDVLVEGNTIEFPSAGISLYESENCKIQNNDVYSEGEGFPIFLLNSHDNEITGNKLESQVGTLVLAGSNRNLIEDNTIVGHHNHGVVLMYSSDGNTIKRNTISAEESGISIWGWDNRVEENIINGDVVEIHMGIYMVHAYNSVITGNDISDVFVEGLFLRHCSNNLIADNTVTAREDIPGYAGPAFGLLLWSHSQNNVCQLNTFTGFDRGIALYSNSDNNAIASNRVMNTTLEGIILEGSSNNIIFADNEFSNIGRPSYDSGENTWNFAGSLSGPALATQPQFENPVQRVITGQETIEDETMHLTHLSIEDGASLVLRNVTVLAGAERRLDEGQRSVMHDVGIDVASGGSLTIDNCRIRHHEYGNGFQVALQRGSSFTMRDSEIHGAGSEWGYGGIRIETNNPVLEGNLITESIVNCFDCGSGSRIVNNRILNSYFAINLSNSSNLVIRDNVIKGSIRPAITGSASHLRIEGNLIADGWEGGIELWAGSDYLIADNTFFQIREPGNAINMWGANNQFIRNRVIDSYRGISLNGGETAVGNLLENCNVGLIFAGTARRVEGNIIRDCELGIELEALINTLSANTITDCATGIAITSGGITGNILYLNNFNDNSVHAVDHGSNHWSHEGQGNFWSDYTGVDTNHDGIGDTAYSIPPNGSDPHPLIAPHQDWTASAFTAGRIVYPQLALGGDPEAYECIVVVSNKTNFDWRGVLRAFRGNHDGWNVDWEIDGQTQKNTALVSLEILPKGSAQIKISGTSTALPGYLEIDAETGSSDFDVALSFFYNLINTASGELLDSVGVPPGSLGDEFMLPVERSTSVNTGLAWTAAAETDPFTVTLTLVDSAGQQVGSTEITYDGHLAKFFTEIFKGLPDRFIGRLCIESEEPIYAIGMRLEYSKGGFQLTGVPLDGFIF
jgi:parallel beta-helix repeat protein